jgi:FAD:protein FMN transferase
MVRRLKTTVPPTVPSRWRLVERDPIHHTVTLPPGLHLELGGTAKGWAAARAADMLVSLGPCLVDAGGDLAVRGGLPGTDGWPIGVADPDDDEAPLATIIVRDRGVATSGVDYRRWISNGVVQHHIIDPRTGYPAATDLRTATVVAPDAATADLYALVVMVLGRAPGLVLLDKHADLDGVLVDQAGRRWQTSGMGRYLYER